MELELGEEEKKYLSILSNNDEELFKQFLHSLRPGADGGDVQKYYEQMVELTLRLPYPTLQILELTRERSKFFVDRIITEALRLFLEKNTEEFSLEFINFLANFPINILDNVSLRHKLIQQITTVSNKDQVYLALLGRKETKLLDKISTYLERQWENSFDTFPSKEMILYLAYKKKLHFVPVVCAKLKSFKCIKDVAIHNNMLILKIINEFANPSNTLSSIGNIAKWLDEYNLDEMPTDLQEVHKFFYADFQRIALILEFLKKNAENYKTIKIEKLLNATGILDLLYEYQIDAKYEETRRLIESINAWQKQMPTVICTCDQELAIFNYYFALRTVYEVIIEDSAVNIDQYYTSKMSQLNTILRQIKMDVLCSLIEDIFKMIFLRWSDIQNTSNVTEDQGARRKSIRTDSSSSDEAADTVISTLVPPTTTTTTRNSRCGFICREKALHTIFMFLKNFTTKKLHTDDYKQAPKWLQNRFQKIVDNISYTLWKYSVLQKIDESLMRADSTRQHCELEPDDILQLVKFHVNPVEKSSSDDEGYDRSTYRSLTRRKLARNRRRATFSGAAVSRRTHPAEQCQARGSARVTRVHSIQTSTGYRSDVARSSREYNIIPKMLTSPEDLAFMALASNNFNEVKNIIEKFNLHNNNLNQELKLVEQQQQVKQKLATIYKNYQQLEQNSSQSHEPKATVEQIKNVAAKGFEVSKIIGVIDNFAQSQRIQQTPELKQLLLKYSNHPHYAFLRQFDESNLNAILIMDLILDLPFNHEITSNILMVIKRQQQQYQQPQQQQQQPPHISNNTTSKTHIPKIIGPLAFLENLYECLRLMPYNTTLRDLLTDNYYSLQPRKLAVELQREQAFHVVFSKTVAEIGNCDDLKAHAPLFQNLQSNCNYYNRFHNYIVHLTKLLQLRDSNLKYHTGELLKIDPCEIIGELLFECNMTPLEIEANVTALNLNLVHVIASNICPEIVGKRPNRNQRKHNQLPRILPQQHETIFNYISNQNRLLAFLLLSIINGNTFNWNDNDQCIYLQRLFDMPAIKTLATLYGGNGCIAVLLSDHLNMELVEQLNSKLDQLHILLLDIGVQEPKHLKQTRIDNLVVELIEMNARNIKYVVHISNIELRAKLILENFTKIPTIRLAKELIETTLYHKDALQLISQDLRDQLQITLADITIYAEVSEVLQFETWPQAYDFGLKTPSTIFEKLLQLHLYKLCYKWCGVVKLSERFANQKQSFLTILLDALLELNDDAKQGADINQYLLKILETFPIEDCVKFLETHKDKFRSLILLEYAIDFLSLNSTTSDSFKNYRISLVIFKQLSSDERAQFWPLFKFPLLTIEQLIMNAKFEITTNVLAAVRKSLQIDQMKMSEAGQVCQFCFDKRGNIYDIHIKGEPSNVARSKQHFQLGSDVTSASAFILLNFNPYQKDHIITNDCIDLMLRIYASKALDYHISDSSSSSERISQTTDFQQSLDSLCDTFQIPKTAPSRDDWVRDDEATHCMCCRRTAFTMLMRRHHCRRCGRVVCYACSLHRMRIPELYDELEVRICNDCHRNEEEDLLRKAQHDSDADPNTSNLRRSEQCQASAFKWKLSGNITHDKLLREEFSYEHAPSVALCLSILGYHLDQQKCVDLLLYHCRKLEKLIVPNPEVDYELVAKMMNCLALAAKVRGGPADIETIREHSEIIISVVQNGCASLIPPGPLSNHSLRKLGDSLVQAEKWELALEVHLKCGFPTTGVMAAHGLACLKAGCFNTAREKFSHCMPKFSNDSINSIIYKFLVTPQNVHLDNVETPGDYEKEHNIPKIRRAQRGPPLLKEILNIVEATPFVKPQAEALQRASVIRNSTTSLVSLLSRRKEPYVAPLSEPALNVLAMLANLKNITKGNYTHLSGDQLNSNNKETILHTRGFEECMHYALSYGSHTDILQFLMRHNELEATLKYVLVQDLDSELFIQDVYLVSLRCGQIPVLIDKMLEIDKRLLIWRNILLQTCRYLETQNFLNSLYQLQILLKDPVRASMTCVKFYSMNCENFQQLNANAMHLRNAQMHLQSELEISQWENMNLEPSQRTRKGSASTSRRSSTACSIAPTFRLRMDARVLNGHINSILKQLEVAKFLAKCEKENSPADGLITDKILKQIRIESGKEETLPTLFDNAQDRIQICILILICGKNVEEGFGLAYSIIQNYKLQATKVFAATAKYLARNQRLSEVEKLLNCITSNNGTSTRDIDDILSVAINSAVNTHEPDIKAALDQLVKKIHNIETRISCHIFIGQLKSAYLLANKHERLNDIRKILRQAELLNQSHIKRLCEKKLNMNTPSES